MSKAFIAAKEKYQAVIDDAGRGDFAGPTALAPLVTLLTAIAMLSIKSTTLNNVDEAAQL
ncbi:uncharacterized protein F4822DRAFT_1895 [Hypoxylon trugodes]|uniref:uncharacterized protein n=1 Tax=Hypoxylon trugodes TaxID=326681 RepID=UPI00219B6E5D|nr:uncharacterized protein F4822DRAFT_1895 [Hypoxylon trugodes]KAI1393156.1 hypothetical protein F4822DRAFT_1895 [Hypoxylon trugodes]